VIDHIKMVLAEHGGRLEGDPGAGSFEAMTPGGMLREAYTIDGLSARIDIHDKPWMPADSMIEKVLQEYFG
jgi:hypothetical protein